MIKSLLVGLLLLCSVTASGAATYLPVGPQANVFAGDVLNGGWSIVYSQTIGTPLGIDPANSILGEYKDSLIMLAGREIGSDSFTVLAQALYYDVFYITNNGYDDRYSTHNANGAEWYYTPDWSWGFAPAGNGVDLYNADISNLEDPLRMSLHTMDGVGGWRIGTNTYLNDSTSWETVILVADSGNTPVPEPGTIVLLGIGLAGIAYASRRKTLKM